jgi:hypothetical protein
VGGGDRYCIDIQSAQYVVIRGLELKEVANVAVFCQGTTSDIIIDGCDISGWGSGPDPASPGYGLTRDAAVTNIDRGIGGAHTNVARITVQRCTIHDARWDSNYWSQPETTHPEGPSATFFAQSGGGHVFRYNDAYGSTDGSLVWNDGFTGGWNDNEGGFPGGSTDIYGNILRWVADDGFEIEGGGDMVRVWGNYVDESFNPFATSPTHKGIVYLFRNVADRTRREHNAQASDNGGTFVKCQSFISAGSYGFGPIMIFNNTLLQSDGDNYGCREGVSAVGANRHPRNTTIKNNIFHVTDLKSVNIPNDAVNAWENDVDYNLGNGAFVLYTGGQANGISGTPTYKNGVPPYSPTAPTGDYELAPATDGYEDGVFLPGLTLNTTSASPDMGAHQHGTSVIQYGPLAFLPEETAPAPVAGTARFAAGSTNSQPTRRPWQVVGV